ncbi:Uncharacterised protein [Clostridioides difficile]|uniref:hypothetical protein n=1 Tax=Clostridioides difficile TaxID=1496 RepID=UPI0010268422|nr:hypothetical protein [Clostridioides difficile]VFE55571.1 Uncharacterised protein [Clostridioides difficile]VIH47952.1 Uncharacterised protein [Clostridioides difficile]
MIIKDKIKKFRIFIFINIILATVIGIYAQDIAYYIVGDYSVNIAQLYLYILTVLTILSIILFLATPILIHLFVKKHQLKGEYLLYILLVVDILIGILTSMFSLFVLAMSWG